MGDLELLQQSLLSQKPNKSKDKNVSVDNRPKGLGLGYEKDISQAELEANNQIQKLKNQIKRQSQADSDPKLSKTSDSKQESLGKFGVQRKDNQAQLKDSLIQDKKDKKRLKKERQKAKKQDDKNNKLVQKPAEVKEELDPLQQKLEKSKVYMRIKRFDQMKNEELKKKAEEEGNAGQIKKFRTKTRSKQKNLRKDKRPLEVKMAKLANKGIIIKH